MGRNSKILDEALHQLPSYFPNEKVWDDINSQLSEATMADRLSQLNSINPSELVWDTIANELEKDKIIQQLKEFMPSDAVWNKIAKELNTKKEISSKLIAFRWSTWLTAASVVLFMAYFIILQNQQKPTISYSEEVIEIAKSSHWQDDETEIIELVNALCVANPIACNQADFKAKRDELDYLNEKKSEILERLNAYDKNKDFQIMLTKIELEKNEIVKQMISIAL